MATTLDNFSRDADIDPAASPGDRQCIRLDEPHWQRCRFSFLLSRQSALTWASVRLLTVVSRPFFSAICPFLRSRCWCSSSVRPEWFADAAGLTAALRVSAVRRGRACELVVAALAGSSG
jgi:hypothetical protein